VVVTEQRVLAVWNHDGIPLSLGLADRYAPFDRAIAEKYLLTLVDGFTAHSRPPAGLAARVALCVNVVRPAWRWLASNTRSAGVRLEPATLDRICTDDRRAGSRRAIGRSSSARWTRCRHPAGACRAASLDLAARQADGDRVVVALVVMVMVVMVAILRGDLKTIP
jgi:hypothetical protein